MQSGRHCQFMFVSVGTEEEASQISRALVEEHLAACVSRVSGVTSVYRWKGEIQEDNEIMLIIKTRKACAEQVEKLIKSLHTYDVPEIVSVSFDEASGDYLSWLVQETKT